MKEFINTLPDTVISVLDNVIYLDIETTGLDPFNSEIIEIGAIKIKNREIQTFTTLIKNNKEIPIEIYSLCSGLEQQDLRNAPTLKQASDEFLNFIEDDIIICHNASFDKKFLNYYIPKVKNKIIDSMELASIVEPYHKEYSLDYLKKYLTNNKENEKHRALSDSIDTLRVVNSLIMRLKKKEESTLEPLTFKINLYLNKFMLPKWEWSELIENADYKEDDYIKQVFIEEKNNSKIKENIKEKEVLKKILQNNKSYEELLKDKDIWASKEGFIYEYRPGQYELTKTIRETFKGNSGSSKIACIEAPTGIGKSVGYLLPAILESRIYNKRVIISTDTKELQIQLINKDIPNVLNSLGLNNKVSYGYIKGKNNYICVEKLESYKKDYTIKDHNINEILAIIILERLVEEGEYGDIEEINYWILNHFEEINTHLRYVGCDPNLCRPKKCFKDCLYKKRTEELKEEDITVINHSLLAKWPYKEEKPLEHIIVDEGHNLAEKGYDFFSSVIDYKMLNYFLREIYPYENMQNSAFAYDNSNKNRKIKPFDKFYHHVHFDRNIKDKISRNINFIIEKMKNILNFGVNSDYKNISKYNLRWELNLQEDEIAGKIRKNNEIIELKYSKYSQQIKMSCESIIRNLVSILVIIDRNLDDESIDKESDVYKFGKARIKELEDIKTAFELFMEYSKDDDFARIVEINKDYTNFEIRVVPLKLAELFEENILAQVESAIFLSATLSVENSMDYFKKTLGINRVDNVEKIIEPLYDYKNRVSIIGLNDLCNYSNNEFPKEMGSVIGNISQITQGHLLSLFNSKDRLEKTYENLIDDLHRKNTEVYMNKKGIKYLKDINKKCVVLGSKGCFEGVDVPGDGLICVTLDKIPNLNPKDPLYSTIMKKYNLPYHVINYPQMAIKVKQAMGRLLRSKYDYGCFIIFNTGTNLYTLKKLERDLHGCRINLMGKSKIQDYMNSHLYMCRKNVMNEALLDIIKSLKYSENMNMKNIENFMNEEMENRYIKSNVAYLENEILKVRYFNQSYLIPKERLRY